VEAGSGGLDRAIDLNRADPAGRSPSGCGGNPGRSGAV